MKMTMICPGKIKGAWLGAAIQEYSKRLSRDVDLNIIELADAPDHLSLEQALLLEEKQIVAKLPSKAFVVLLDLHGEELSSEQLAQCLSRWFEESGAHIYVIIGGSRGVAEGLRKIANKQIKLSNLTFTHLFTRLIWLEQVYRAFRINKGDPYHK